MKRILSILMAAMLLVLGASPALSEDLTALDGAVEEMLPVLDSAYRTLGVEGEFAYDIEDTSVFWTTIYLLAVNWCTDIPTSEIADDAYLHLTEEDVTQMAYAAFATFEEPLPEIPGDLAESVIYNSEYARYEFALSDMGDTFIKIESYVADAESETITVNVGFYGYGDDGEELLGEMGFVLVDNPFAAQLDDPMFTLSILSVGMG